MKAALANHRIKKENNSSGSSPPLFNFLHLFFLSSGESEDQKEGNYDHLVRG